MKDKLFFLLGLPAVWLIITFLAYHPAADKLYLMTVAASAWVFLFVDQNSVSILQMKIAALPMMFLAGVILWKLKIKPRTATISAFVITVVLWVMLLITLRNTRVINEAGAPGIWFLCCFNFSLCLLPFLAMPVKLIVFAYQNIKRPKEF